MSQSSRSINHTDFFIVGIDSNARLIAFNRRCEEFTGYRRDEVLHKKVWGVIFPKGYKKDWHNIFVNRAKRIELPLLDKKRRELHLVWSPMEVGIRDKEIWLIGIEKPEENKLWELLDIKVVADPSDSKENEDLHKKVDDLVKVKNSVEIATNLIEKQWKRLYDYLEQLDRLRRLLEKEGKKLQKDKKNLEKQKREVENLIEKKLFYFERKLREKMNRLSELDEKESLLDSIEKKLDKVGWMERELERMLNDIERRETEINDLKKKIEMEKEELEKNKRELAVKTENIKNKEKEIARKEKEIRKRIREIEEKEREIQNLRIKLDNEKRLLAEKSKEIKRLLELEKSKIAEQIERKYKDSFEKKLEDLRKKLEGYKVREKELKRDIDLLKKREKELEKEIEKYRSKERELEELEKRIGREKEEIRRLEEEINVKSKLLEEIENKEREIIQKEKNLQAMEMRLKSKERELIEKEKELKRLLIESSTQPTLQTSLEEIKVKEEEKKAFTLSDIENPAALIRKGMICEANESFLSLTGFSREELINRSFFSLVDPEELPNFQRYYLSRLKGANVDSIDATIVNNKNEKIPVKIKLDQIKLEDGIFDLALIEMHH